MVSEMRNDEWDEIEKQQEKSERLRLREMTTNKQRKKNHFISSSQIYLLVQFELHLSLINIDHDLIKTRNQEIMIDCDDEMVDDDGKWDGKLWNKINQYHLIPILITISLSFFKSTTNHKFIKYLNLQF